MTSVDQEPEAVTSNGAGGAASAMPEAAAAASTTVLDLTNSHLRNLEGVTISPSLTQVDLTCNRLKSIDPRILALTELRSINFRQNLLADLSAWNKCSCKGTLEDIEFRDNEVMTVPQLDDYPALKRLELSYNMIKSLAPLASLQAPQLQELYVASNKVSRIECLQHLTALEVLELGSNRIRQLEGLDSLTQLRELWLGRNRITKVEGLQALSGLRRLSLQSNRLESMAGLEVCTGLEELYLSHNGIKQLEGLDHMPGLKILDVSTNAITRISGLDALTQLEDLWLNDNQIPSMDAAFHEGLKPVLDVLTCIYLEGNPLASHQDYKRRVRAMFPQLKQLDSEVMHKEDLRKGR